MDKQIEKTLQQKKFLENYSNTLDIGLSAIQAGYKAQTAKANGTNILSNPKWQKEFKRLCDEKANYMSLCKAYFVTKYLKILDWALLEDDKGKLTDPAIAIRALDGLIKQLQPNNNKDVEESTSIITAIEGLDTRKI